MGESARLQIDMYKSLTPDTIADNVISRDGLSTL